MALLTPNWNPDRSTARNFAALWLVCFASLGLYRAWSSGTSTPLLLVVLAIAVGVPGLLKPELVRPIYIGWMALAYPVGWTISHVLLAVVYFGLFTLLGMLFRIAGRDPLKRSLDREASSYWMERKPAPKASRYFRLS